MKKILCLLLSLFMLSCLSASAQEASEWDFNAYDLVLNAYNGAGGDVIVPELIDNAPVETIGIAAFNAQSAVTSIALPSSVRWIRDSAISYCENLASVVLPENLLFIGSNCFNDCYALTGLTIPASVCYIGDSSFISLTGLTSVVFEGPCPYFAGTAFDWLSDQTVIYVPDDQIEAYSAAFNNMNVSVNLQPSGKNAVVYDYITDPDMFGFDPATGTITAYNGFDLRVDVPAQIGGIPVKAIGPSAFYDNYYLAYLALPEGLESIGDSAFESCNELMHIEFPSTLKVIGARAFSEGISASALYLPDGLESIGDEAFLNSYRLMKGLELPEGLKTIGTRAFGGCGWLSEVYFSESIESVGTEAFADSGITYAVFEGETLPEMADDTFSGCGYLADIDLHNKASKQDMLALQGIVDALGLECRVWRLQNPDVDYIYDGLDTYDNGVLTGYTGAQTHIRPWDTYDDVTVTAVGDGAFRGSTTLEYFAVCYNDAFTTIGAEAFADSSVAYVDLFDSVTTIKEGAFRNCRNITSITIPESVTEIAPDAFEGCSGLESITILCDPSILTEGMFNTCTALTEVNGPDIEALSIAVFGLPEVTITRQPEDVFAPEGEWAELTVEAEGEGLTYAWYVMTPSDVDYLPDASATGNTYGIYVDGSTEFTQAYCVVTDKYGTSVTSGSASFFVDTEEEEFIPIPVGAEGEPYFGTWKCISIEMEGTVTTLADLGMVMDFTFKQDGTVDIFDGEYTDTGVWGVYNGILSVMEATGMIGDDGVLTMDDHGSKMILVRGE